MKSSRSMSHVGSLLVALAPRGSLLLLLLLFLPPRVAEGTGILGDTPWDLDIGPDSFPVSPMGSYMPYQLLNHGAVDEGLFRSGTMGIGGQHFQSALGRGIELDDDLGRGKLNLPSTTLMTGGWATSQMDAMRMVQQSDLTRDLTGLLAPSPGPLPGSYPVSPIAPPPVFIPIPPPPPLPVEPARPGPKYQAFLLLANLLSFLNSRLPDASPPGEAGECRDQLRELLRRQADYWYEDVTLVDLRRDFRIIELAILHDDPLLSFHYEELREAFHAIYPSQASYQEVLNLAQEIEGWADPAGLSESDLENRYQKRLMLQLRNAELETEVREYLQNHPEEASQIANHAAAVQLHMNAAYLVPTNINALRQIYGQIEDALAASATFNDWLRDAEAYIGDCPLHHEYLNLLVVVFAKSRALESNSEIIRLFEEVNRLIQVQLALFRPDIVQLASTWYGEYLAGVQALLSKTGYQALLERFLEQQNGLLKNNDVFQALEAAGGSAYDRLGTFTSTIHLGVEICNQNLLCAEGLIGSYLPLSGQPEAMAAIDIIKDLGLFLELHNTAHYEISKSSAYLDLREALGAEWERIVSPEVLDALDHLREDFLGKLKSIPELGFLIALDQAVEELLLEVSVAEYDFLEGLSTLRDVRDRMEAILAELNPPAIEVAPLAVSFETVLVGQEGARIVRIRNAGYSRLEVSGISSTEASFRIVPPEPFSLEPGREKTLFIRFAPLSRGERLGSLRLLSTDPDNPVVVVSLSGQGIESAGIQQLALDDGSLDTRLGPVGGGRYWVVNRITPDGYPATLTGVSAYFADAGNSAREGDPIEVLAGTNGDGDQDIDATPFLRTPAVVAGPLGQFLYFDVPDQTIERGDFLVGCTMDVPGNTFPFAMDQSPPSRRRSYESFDGVEFRFPGDANPALEGNWMIRGHLLPRGAAEITLTPAALAFGTVPAAVVPIRTLLVSNPGTATLLVTRVASSSTAFSVPPATFTLPPGESRDIAVGFVAAMPGSTSGTIQVESNAAGSAVETVSLSARRLSVDETLDLVLDDGSFEIGVGPSSSATYHAVNRITPEGYPATLTALGIFFDAAQVPPGSEVTLLVGVNLDGDTRIDGTSFQETRAVVIRDGFNLIDVPDVTIDRGDLVVGFKMEVEGGTFPASLDTTNPLPGRSYDSRDGMTFTLMEDYNVPTLRGNWAIRAVVTDLPLFARFRRGDSNSDGTFNITDAIHTLGVLFLGQGTISCMDAADSNDDGFVNISDPSNTLGVLFLGTRSIPLPGPQVCGEDPTGDSLICEAFPPCDGVR